MKTVEEEVDRVRRTRPIPEALVPFGMGVLLTLVAGLAWRQGSGQVASPLHEGVISSVSWTEGEKSGAFLARGHATIAVPGGNGGGNTGVDMRGRLYPTHLEVRFQRPNDRRVQVIPLHRIVSLVFDDGEAKSSP